MNKVLSVKCPQCGTKFSYFDSTFRPFCSEKCKMIDLGHWLTESYKIPEKNFESSKNEAGAENIEDHDETTEESQNEYPIEEDDQEEF